MQAFKRHDLRVFSYQTGSSAMILLKHKTSLFTTGICLILSALFIQSCDVADSGTETESCILNQIQFDEFNTLNFSTVSGGKVFEIKQENTSDGDTEIVASFRFIYQPDSISVNNQLDVSSQQPFMSVKLEDERPVKVNRFFSMQGVRLQHEISYPDDETIRIDLTRFASTGDVLYVGYSLYHKDSSGNVVHYERFSANRENPGDFTKEEDNRYTYDTLQSAQKGLYLPFFNSTGFPDVRFFSSGNLTSFSDGNQTLFYENEYGPDDQLESQRLPNGQVLLFGYANC